MKLKIQVIMGLVCLSCGYHAEGRVNPGVTELAKEQKDDLKKMYGMYQLFTTTSGIPEDAVAKARTEPLPWVKAEREFDPTPEGPTE
ncbi:hypothetical protein [Bacteroides ovatus]|uniref:hypothetical protein n=1 Tax=Bacteroides ovatus TaxID=28116 RepID=UPI0039B45E50